MKEKYIITTFFLDYKILSCLYLKSHKYYIRNDKKCWQTSHTDIHVKCKNNFFVILALYSRQRHIPFYATDNIHIRNVKKRLIKDLSISDLWNCIDLLYYFKQSELAHR